MKHSTVEVRPIVQLRTKRTFYCGGFRCEVHPLNPAERRIVFHTGLGDSRASYYLSAETAESLANLLLAAAEVSQIPLTQEK